MLSRAVSTAAILGAFHLAHALAPQAHVTAFTPSLFELAPTPVALAQEQAPPTRSTMAYGDGVTPIHGHQIRAGW